MGPLDDAFESAMTQVLSILETNDVFDEHCRIVLILHHNSISHAINLHISQCFATCKNVHWHQLQVKSTNLYVSVECTSEMYNKIYSEICQKKEYYRI